MRSNLLLQIIFWICMVAAATAQPSPESELGPSSERIIPECLSDAGCPTEALPYCARQKTALGYKKRCSQCRTSADCPVDAQPCDEETKTCQGARLVPTITAVVRFSTLENATDANGETLCSNIMEAITVPKTVCRVDGILEAERAVVLSIYSFDDLLESYDGMAELLGLLTSNSLELRYALSRGLENFGLPVVASTTYEVVKYDPKKVANSSDAKAPTVVSTTFAPQSCALRVQVSWLPATPTRFNNPTYMAYVVTCSSETDVQVKAVPGYSTEATLDLRSLGDAYVCKVASVALESSLSEYADSAPFVALLPEVCVTSTFAADESSRSYPCPSGDATCFCNYIGKDGLYADTKVGCKDYYQCGGAAGDFYRPCPPGLLFDDVIQYFVNFYKFHIPIKVREILMKRCLFVLGDALEWTRDFHHPRYILYALNSRIFHLRKCGSSTSFE